MVKEKKGQNQVVKSTKSITPSNKEYASLLLDLKRKVKEAQLKAVTAVNKELLSLYWTIGKSITEKQKENGWGSAFVEKLAKDLQTAFPGIEGFSRTNVFRMRTFYKNYEKIPPAVGQIDSFEKLGILTEIPWSHNVILMEKIDSVEERMWYAHKTIVHGWSRSMLETWIKANLYKREGKAVTNFKGILPDPQSDLAQQALKDPYNFDFLTLHNDFLEKDLENGLVNHIQKFLIELGQGFAFLGKQYPIVVEGDTSYIDLLFYHVKLHCYVVVEIKARAFKPEDVGQLNYYLSAVDDQLKHFTDNPTIGILLCKSRNKVKAEYAFRHVDRPMGVVEFETMVTSALPTELKSKLPTVKEIEEELEKSVQNK